MPHIRLQSIKSQDHLLLFCKPHLEPLRIGQVSCHQFFIAVELIGHRTLRNLKTSSYQVFSAL